jgi:acyl carrier protein
MTREQILERANKIFREVFDDDTIIVTEETTANDIEDWDSLMHINLVLAIEDDFGMKFSMGEVIKMKNVGEMAEILMERSTK